MMESDTSRSGSFLSSFSESGWYITVPSDVTRITNPFVPILYSGRSSSMCSREISAPATPIMLFPLLSYTGVTALKIVFPVLESSYALVSIVHLFSTAAYHERVVTSKLLSDVNPSDCVSTFASISAIHTA